MAVNRLIATAGPAPAQTNTYDAAGNLLSNGTASFTYSDRGRLARASVGANAVNYLYDGLGQRVSKHGPAALVPGTLHLYTYDEAGRLIGEYDASSPTPRVRQETVFLGDTPVAVLTQSVTGSPAVFSTAVHYVWPDHLDTPRVITQASDNRIRWRWDQADPFGIAAPNQNPTGLGTFSYSPRFPGQFYDVESNLHYNYFRDYDPRVGRYVQSDPIGLEGGLNTYTYAFENPLRYTDPEGLAPGDKNFGISDPGFWKWWEQNKYSYGPFDKSHDGFNPAKPFDIPNKAMAEVMKEEYDQCKPSGGGRGNKSRGPKLPRIPRLGGGRGE